MGAIAEGLELQVRVRQCGIVHERAQQLVVAAVGFVRAGQNRIHDTKRVACVMRWFAIPSPARTRPLRQRVFRGPHDGRADGDDPSALQSDVAQADAVASGMRYGSSNGSRRSRSGSPVDERPAARVIVANPMPRSRIARDGAQSSAKPADGGSNATG